jgi:predicted PurR-regulated permease PerM
MVIGRFHFVVIALAVVIIAGFAVLGAQIWLMNARIDQLATKVSGIDVTFGMKLDEINAKLDAISQRLPAEFKTIGAEIAAQTSAITKSIASLRGLAPSPPTSLLPEPATGPKPAPPPKARP